MTSPQFKIRIAVKEDLTKVLNLIKSQHGETAVKIAIDDLQAAAGFSDNIDSQGSLTCFVVEDTSSSNDSIVGYATAYYVYSTWEGRSLEIQDFYLKPENNNIKLHQDLLKEIVTFARNSSCSRVDFHIAKRNEDLKTLFCNAGAVNLTETEGWYLYSFSRESLEELQIQ